MHSEDLPPCGLKLYNFYKPLNALVNDAFKQKDFMFSLRFPFFKMLFIKT